MGAPTPWYPYTAEAGIGRPFRSTTEECSTMKGDDGTSASHYGNMWGKGGTS